MSQKSIKAQEESSKLAAEVVTNLRTVTAFSSQLRILQMLKKAQEGPQQESIRQSWFAGIRWDCTWHFQQSADMYLGSPFLMATKPKKITGLVEMCEVVFAYPSRPNVIIFKGFSINMEEGKSTALVGQSGSGKSTIIALIERFYDPLSGVVKIDGRDIRSYHLRFLRKHIALVSQEPTLFAGTIRKNIAYGALASEEVDESEIIEAAKAVNAHGFISSLKDGYKTWCGDRGLQLSGGQKQRIVIARTILKNPGVLLLDEATSALDSQLEKLVQDALE
ncbi:putative multidrug resistance protein [Capsicum annuum]|nr:putative multidrug resistance protein [Capsicum annuum]